MVLVNDPQAVGEALYRYRRLGAYWRRTGSPGCPRSSKWRAGTRRNKRHRTVPTFASDLRPMLGQRGN